LLESPTLAPNDKRAVAAHLEQTQRLTSITESLLLLSRADAGRLNLDLVDANVCEIVEACTEDAQILAEPRNITLETRLPESLHAFVDVGRLTQILLNLLTNAVKYNRDSGEVSIAAAAEDGSVVITVANTGPGIARSAVPQLFERFFRSDSNGHAAGHGLGLSLARELARAHGGDVTLVQSDEKWTVFKVRIGPVTSESHWQADRTLAAL
jgi:signal transduction histidine kinase